MNNISKEAEKVLQTIKQYGPIRSVDIVKLLKVSTKTTYKHLTKLLDDGLIKKSGTTPKVFYFINTSIEDNTNILNDDDRFIEQNYIYVSPSGEMARGLGGFLQWCRKNNLDIEKEKKLFISKYRIIQHLKKDELISAKKKILSGKGELYLDDIFFSDFYTFDHFGKTKLGQLVYLGKTSQNKELIAEIAKLTKSSILKIIEKYNIKNICFIPPTVDRKVQFLDIFRKKLQLDINEIKIEKIASLTKVPQKTLRKLEDRIINAKTTIVVNPNQIIKANVLIIDDATGSGATLNETANKIRSIAKGKIRIIGYSVVGSYKGFDVISEV